VSDIQQRIADAIAHADGLPEDADVAVYYGADAVEHYEKLARAVVSELGLTEIVEQDSEPGSPRWRYYASPREQAEEL
jgi:hypothetical protein